MNIDINHKDKVFAIWMNRGESLDNILESASELVSRYRSRKYAICTFNSGGDDAINATSSLLHTTI